MMGFQKKNGEKMHMSVFHQKKREKRPAGLIKNLPIVETTFLLSMYSYLFRETNTMCNTVNILMDETLKTYHVRKDGKMWCMKSKEMWVDTQHPSE